MVELKLLKSSVSYRFVKTIIDRLIAFLAFILLLPLLLVVFFLVRYKFGAPVFYIQKRVGYSGRIFGLVKFRSMTNASDRHGHPLPDSERLTPFGRWLRSTSIDELPSLLNIILGDMSFIGPRPLLVQYLDYYSDEQARRHNVMPGFSGLAQINGRNTLSWHERFRLDVLYVDNQCFWLDIYILFSTIYMVLSREGITPIGLDAMPPFLGDPPNSSYPVDND